MSANCKRKPGMRHYGAKEFHRNTTLKKKVNLSNVLQKILTTRLEPADQAKILQSSLETSVDHTVLDNVMLPTETNSINKSKLLSGVIKYLKGLDLRNTNSINLFVNLLSSICEGC